MKARRHTTPDVRAANRDIAERLAGLPLRAANMVRAAAQAMERGDLAGAELSLLTAAIQAPDHPEIARHSGLIQMKRGRHADAVAEFTKALAARPDDASVLTLLAEAQSGIGDDIGAFASLKKAAAYARQHAEWLKLGVEFDRQGHAEEALAAADHAIELGASDGDASLLRARCLQALGQPAAAAAVYRKMIANGANTASAWYGMLDQKTIRITDAELKALENAEYRAVDIPGDDRTMLAFALGTAYEGAARYAEALATFKRANAYASADRPWNAAIFGTQVESAQSIFEHPVQRSDIEQGDEVIFVVGLPRSGTTLTEQILAAHPQVEGASELPYLQRVIGAESERRGKPFSQWTHEASPQDWARLGQRYLALSARWRTQRPRATDKLPGNWLFAGAVTSMLPNARIIGCRRDPVETCWSCYKQLFAKGMVGFAYDFGNLAAYWHDYDRLSRFWAVRFPDRFRTQHYEKLVAEPESQIRELLHFCGLPFDRACLDFHEAQRSVRTASAAQVRQPLRKDTARTGNYGELLEPLRALLAARNAD